MAKEFKVTLNLVTKDDFSIVELQTYYQKLCINNSELKSFEVKTEVKEQ